MILAPVFSEVGVPERNPWIDATVENGRKYLLYSKTYSPNDERIAAAYNAMLDAASRLNHAEYDTAVQEVWGDQNASSETKLDPE